MPLFPGYVFVRIDRTAEAQLQVRKVPGVADFVKNQHGPMVVAEHELENVRALLMRGITVTPHSCFAAGDLVRVMRGPLAGVEGTYVRAGGRSRLVISVQLIQQAVAVEVEETNVESLAGKDDRLCA
jgi:transcription antitermination factor NusG